MMEHGDIVFANRQEAGRMLAAELAEYKIVDPVVLALPRGGVPVAYEVAYALQAPLDVLVARKLGAPGQPELAIGAVVDGDNPQTVLNREIIEHLHVSERALAAEVARELKEVARRKDMYRQGRAPIPLEGATVIVVDDGIATGATVRAAIRGVHHKSVAKVVLAVPVAPLTSVHALKKEVDTLVCLQAPAYFGSVGAFYEDFHQVSDAEVTQLLEQAERWARQPAGQRATHKGDGQ